MVDDAETPATGGWHNLGGGPSSSARGSLSSREGISNSDPGLDRLQGAVLANKVRARGRSLKPSVPAPEPGASWTDLIRTVFQQTQEALEARGVHTLAASRAATRSARLVWLAEAGVQKKTEAAGALGVSVRQVERDWALVRELGRIEASPGLPRIPTPPDRVVIPPGRGGRDNLGDPPSNTAGAPPLATTRCDRIMERTS